MMVRPDGRAEDEMREIRIKRDYILHAEGSCLIEFGRTRLVCTATVEERLPMWRRNERKGWITAEYSMLPRSNAQRNPRDRQSGRNYEIQRIIGRSLRSIVDMSEMGERTITIDCDVLQADGGTRTVAITGGFIALHDAFQKLIKAGDLKSMPMRDCIAAVSIGIVDGFKVLDLCYEEDFRAEVDMNVVMTGKGMLVEVQGTAERKPFSTNSMNEMVMLAKKGIDEIIDIEKSITGFMKDA